MRWNSLAFLGGLALLQGCGEAPAYDARLVAAYADLRVASQEYGDATEEGRRARLQILAREGYTPATFDSARLALQSDPYSWRSFQDAVMARLDSLRDAFTPPELKPKTGRSKLSSPDVNKP